MTYDEFINDIISTRGRVLDKKDKERHHILPRCMGGSDAAENLVDLELGEHFTAHKLLAEENPDCMKLQYAFRLMSRIRRVEGTTFITTPEEYAKAKLANKNKLVKTHYGKALREETKRKISRANKGKKRSPEVVKKYSERMKKYYEKNSAPMKGRKHSEETRAKMREAHKHRDPSTYKMFPMDEASKAERVRKFKETYWAKPEEVRKSQTEKAVKNRKAVRYWQGKTIPQEMRDKISATLKEKNLAPPHSIKVYCLETDTVYRSMTQAEKYTGVNRHAIRDYINGIRKDDEHHFTTVKSGA